MTEEPALEVGHAKMVLFVLYSLNIIEDEGWPEGDVKGRVLFDAAVALHGKEDYAAAAARFLQAAASFASVPQESSFVQTILKNRDLACANARVAFINGGLEVELAKTAEALENMDPACAKQLKR